MGRTPYDSHKRAHEANRMRTSPWSRSLEPYICLSIHRMRADFDAKLDISMIDRMTRQHIYADIRATQDWEDCILADPNLRGPFVTPGAGKPDRRVATLPNSSSTLVQISGAVMSSGSVVSRDQSSFSLELQDSQWRVKLSSPSFRCCFSKNALNIFEHVIAELCKSDRQSM